MRNSLTEQFDGRSDPELSDVSVPVLQTRESETREDNRDELPIQRDDREDGTITSLPTLGGRCRYEPNYSGVYDSVHRNSTDLEVRTGPEESREQDDLVLSELHDREMNSKNQSYRSSIEDFSIFLDKKTEIENFSTRAVSPDPNLEEHHVSCSSLSFQDALHSVTSVFSELMCFKDETESTALQEQENSFEARTFTGIPYEIMKGPNPKTKMSQIDDNEQTDLNTKMAAIETPKHSFESHMHSTAKEKSILDEEDENKKEDMTENPFSKHMMPIHMLKPETKFITSLRPSDMSQKSSANSRCGSILSLYSRHKRPMTRTTIIQKGIKRSNYTPKNQNKLVTSLKLGVIGKDSYGQPMPMSAIKTRENPTVQLKRIAE